jgi:hypothetical protein
VTSLSDRFGNDREACGVTTTAGDPCRRPALVGFDRCHIHIDDDD